MVLLGYRVQWRWKKDLRRGDDIVELIINYANTHLPVIISRDRKMDIYCAKNEKVGVIACGDLTMFLMS